MDLWLPQIRPGRISLNLLERPLINYTIIGQANTKPAIGRTGPDPPINPRSQSIVDLKDGVYVFLLEAKPQPAQILVPIVIQQLRNQIVSQSILINGGEV